jgi:hypothetical protein
MAKVSDWIRGLGRAGYLVPSVPGRGEDYDPDSPGLDATGTWSAHHVFSEMARLGLRDEGRAMRAIERLKKRERERFHASVKDKYFPLLVLRLAGTVNTDADAIRLIEVVWDLVQRAVRRGRRDGRVKRRGGVDVVLDCSDLALVSPHVLEKVCCDDAWPVMQSELEKVGLRMMVALLPPPGANPYLHTLTDALVARYLWEPGSIVSERNFALHDSRQGVDAALERRGGTGPFPAPPTYNPPQNPCFM